jgi:peptidoglycan/LPS O-acetylase OafA/YrhL
MHTISPKNRAKILSQALRALVRNASETMDFLQSSNENSPAEITMIASDADLEASALSKAAAPGNSTSLDQWRGLALVLVLISHAFFYTGRVHGIGRVGVNLFFFISGILVFRSLAKDRVASRWERGRKFWKRRLMRLYPAMGTFILAIAPIVFLLQNRPGLPPNSDFGHFLTGLPFALGYLENYFTTSMSVGHLWSVSCEMQFYLFAPVIFFLGGSTISRRNVVWGTLLLLLMALGLSLPFFGDDKKYRFEFAVWPMMLGFFCEYQKIWLQEISRRWARSLIRLCLGILAASLLLMLFGLSMKKLVIGAGVFVFIPCFLSYLSGQSMPGLAGRWMAWMGVRTYSIYLWQQPLTICCFLPIVWHPVGAMLSIFVGAVWFHLFERPFLTRGRRAWTANAPLVAGS